MDIQTAKNNILKDWVLGLITDEEKEEAIGKLESTIWDKIGLAKEVAVLFIFAYMALC